MSKIKFYKTGVFINNEFKQDSTVFFDTETGAEILTIRPYFKEDGLHDCIYLPGKPSEVTEVMLNKIQMSEKYLTALKNKDYEIKPNTEESVSIQESAFNLEMEFEQDYDKAKVDFIDKFDIMETEPPRYPENISCPSCGESGVNGNIKNRGQEESGWDLGCYVCGNTWIASAAPWPEDYL
jgi:ssDNA-binding Zn-finger/Zn-ribbon topoisomerase 1